MRLHDSRIPIALFALVWLVGCGPSAPAPRSAAPGPSHASESAPAPARARAPRSTPGEPRTASPRKALPQPRSTSGPATAARPATHPRPTAPAPASAHRPHAQSGATTPPPRPRRKTPQPKVTLVKVRTEGGIPADQARGIASSHTAPLLTCYVNKGNPSTTGVRGRLTMRLLVRRSGAVGKVKMTRSTLSQAELEYCVGKAIKRAWRFSRSRRWVRYVWVTYDFSLYSSHGKTGLTRYVEKPPRTASGISRAQIVRVFGRIRHRLHRACRKRGSASLTLTIRGRSGRVTNIRTSATLPRCVTQVIQRARFPRFKADSMQVTLPIVW